jgi:dolichyl-phosphate-mannose-protein mannosyltransferase
MSFKLHFLILNRSGPGDAQMSSLFQAHLKGNDFAQSPLEVAYGSKLTFKNYGYGGGLLHSHVQTYPVGSLQQQVTCYHYKDENNNFWIYPPWGDKPLDLESELKFLQDGDVIRIVHVPTTRNIHSHAVAAPVTKENYEVSAYGNLTVGDVHDHWVVEVVDDMLLGKKRNVDRIHALTTRMRFRHQILGCYLKAANVPLPQWGWKQIEVTCEKQNEPNDAHTWWNIESHWNDKRECTFCLSYTSFRADDLPLIVPSGNAQLYKSPFWKDFWHLNVAMMTSNNALVPDPDKDDILASQPLDWPMLHLGLRMCGWADNQIKYYLLGTPVIWWGGAVALLAGVLTLGVYMMRMQRQYKDWAEGELRYMIGPHSCD